MHIQNTTNALQIIKKKHENFTSDTNKSIDVKLKANVII